MKRNLKDIHESAIKEFDLVWSAVSEERDLCAEDRRFVALPGASWEGVVGDMFENAPKFESNKIQMALLKVYAEYRNNRIEIDFTSKDGTDNSKLAQFCNGLLRADEKDSNADEAKDGAFDEACAGGFGAWRLRSCYEDESDPENENQRIKFEPIYEAESRVFFDLGAKRQDKSDAKKCWVLSPKTKGEYEDEYGIEDSTSWNYQQYGLQFDWASTDYIWLCEYYEVEYKDCKIAIYEDVAGNKQKIEIDDLDEETLATFNAIGNKKVSERTIKERKVHKYILDGNKVLEDCGYIAGDQIPIVPIYGKRWFIGGIERFSGIVRTCKDSARLGNILRSKLVEIASLSPIEKPIFVPEQMQGHSDMWSNDIVNKYPYMLVNKITGADGTQQAAGPVGYTKPPSIPPAIAALIEVAERDLQDLLGVSNGADKMVSNISAQAVELIQTRVDMQSFIYLSNYAKADKRSAEIWLSMAKEIYVEDDRNVKLIDENGTPSSAKLHQLMATNEGKTTVINNLDDAKFDVTATIGPASQSKRQAAVKNLTAMNAVATDPETKTILEALAMMNMDVEGSEDVNKYYRRKLIKLGALKPTEEEAQQLMQEMQGQAPDAQTQYLNAAAREAEAKAVKANADTVLTIAKAEQTKAETAQTMSTMDISQQEHLMNLAQSLSQAAPLPVASEYGAPNA